MHTAKSLDAMRDEAACMVAEGMGRQLFGNDRFKVGLAEMTGVTRKTVGNWFNTRPPTLAILFMQSEIERRDLDRRVKALKSALSDL